MRSHRLLILLALMSSFLISGCWPHQAGPTDVGVRTVKFGILKKRGVEKTYYAPGKTYFFMPITTSNPRARPSCGKLPPLSPP